MTLCPDMNLPLINITLITETDTFANFLDVNHENSFSEIIQLKKCHLKIISDEKQFPKIELRMNAIHSMVNVQQFREENFMFDSWAEVVPVN